MRRMEYKKYFTLIIVFFALHRSVYAGFEITEIMYDVDGTDTNREWVEVKNTGSEADDLSQWYLFTDNTKHALSPQGSSSVPAGGYAVIAQNASNFRSDWPNFTGLLFDSSWTGLNNDGETIGLKDSNLNIVSEVTFTASMGATGTGDSLQKVNGTWISTVPTPGVENKSGPASNVATITSDSGAKTETTVTPKKKEVEVPHIATNIIANTTVFAGIPFTVTTNTTGYNKEQLKVGRFVWNFGDGTTKEELEDIPFEYSYKYPGEYVITLLYYRVNTNTLIAANDRITIKVLPPQISISSVGKSGDYFVELENKSSLEVDLSRWIIKGVDNSFGIPSATILLPGQKLRFRDRVTHFTEADLSSIVLINSSQEIADTYPFQKFPQVHSSYTADSNKSNVSVQKIESPQIINLNDLGASAAATKNTPSSLSIIAWGGLLIVLVLGSASVLLMRKKDIPDYVDREIRAEDMTIIE